MNILQLAVYIYLHFSRHIALDIYHQKTQHNLTSNL